MIDRVIHYCWFGGNPLPQSAIDCIASWRKYFPDYEIKEWNETNFDINCCRYVKEAYAAKKWAFVSDYARFWVLYNYGGIYFDTDVEVIRNFQDIIDKGPFMGCECSANNVSSEMVAPGLGLAANPGLGLAANPGLGIYKRILEYYDSIYFEYGENTVQTVVTHTTNILKQYGFVGDGTIEKIGDIYIYPAEYFCPMNQFTGKLTITDKTCSIHHYSATWQSGYSRFKSKMQKVLGPNITNSIIKMKRKLLKKHYS